MSTNSQINVSGGAEQDPIMPANSYPDMISEPIAIVGIACRLPGGVKDPNDLWELLISKGSGYTEETPVSRFDINGWYHPDRDRPGSIVCKGGYFLEEDLHQFDNEFFGISPAEAAQMDPAQKKLLEVVYECIESAGIPIDALAGSDTGSFVGNFNYDHAQMQNKDIEYATHYTSTGGAIPILSNRLNYIFNFHGPSFTVDTACSSSMYALHLACNSLQLGDCKGAIVASANIIQNPDTQLVISKLGALSPTSMCHTFDASADGYARAEGVAALYVKKLSNAIKDGDPVRAVIRGTAVNANGSTNGITYPSSDGQERVIRRAYQKAGDLDPALTKVFEFHGTGTPVGDPVEAEAVRRVFSSSTASEPLLIGSVKTNLGHGEACSGLTSILKVVLALEKGIIPPTIGFRVPNPKIHFDKWNMEVVTEPTAWPETTDVRRASVNSFGFGGANAHVIIETTDSFRASKKLQFQVAPVTTNGNLNGTYSRSGDHNEIASNGIHHPEQYLLVVSAKDSVALSGNIRALVKKDIGPHIPEIAYSLSRRSQFRYRAWAVVEDQADAAVIESRFTVAENKKQRNIEPKIGFVFTGQGAQWLDMGRGLASFPAFRRVIKEMDSCLQDLWCRPMWTIEEKLCQERVADYSIDDPVFAQTLCTALQIGLVAILKHWNIIPVATVGHSSGEIAAAYAAGFLSLRDAIIVSYLRGRTVSKRASRSGAMLAVGLDTDTVHCHFTEAEGVALAAVNSPKSFTLSGDMKSILALKDRLDLEGVFNRLLNTDGRAYHSPHMAETGKVYENEMKQYLKPDSTKDFAHEASKTPCNWFSSVTGDNWMQGNVEPGYWRRNLEAPVLFKSALESMASQMPLTHLVEIGPHSALRSPIAQTMQGANSAYSVKYLGAMQRDKNPVDCAMKLAGNLFMDHFPVKVQNVNEKASVAVPAFLTNLPSYQWNHNEARYQENRSNREQRLRKHPWHEILGSLLPGNSKREFQWKNVLSLKSVDWLIDHKVDGQILFPAAGFLALAIEAVAQISHGRDAARASKFTLRDVVIRNALILSNDESHGLEIFTRMAKIALSNRQDSNTMWHFEVTSIQEQGTPTVHAVGNISYDVKREIVNQGSISIKPQKITREILPAEDWYENCSAVGLEYGPSFQRLANLHHETRGKSVTADLFLKKPSLHLNEKEYIWHPAALDCLLQLGVATTYDARISWLSTAFLPISFPYVELQSPGANCDIALATATGERRGEKGLYANIEVFDHSGYRVAFMERACLKLHEATIQRESDQHPPSPYLVLSWKPDIDLLDSTAIKKLFPPLQERNKTPTLLDDLTVLQLIQLSKIHPELMRPDPFRQTKDIQHFLSWASEVVNSARNGEFINGTEYYEMSAAERSAIIRAYSKQLIALDPDLGLFNNIYKNLPDIIRGNTTGMQVGMQDNSLAKFYAAQSVVHQSSKQLARVVDLMGHKNPQLKILEIGAGTGAATRVVLETLTSNLDKQHRRYKDYTFTDVTSSFLEKAQDTFIGFDNMEFRTFNMEEDPIEQGFTSDYDLIIASQSLHVASNMDATIHNVRKLLKNGGKLLLIESTREHLSSKFTVGTYTGYWKQGTDGKMTGPFLSIEQWHDALAGNGFAGLGLVLDDYERPWQLSSILVATAIEVDTYRPSTALLSNKAMNGVKAEQAAFTVITLKGDTELSLELVAVLNQVGGHVNVISLLDPSPLPNPPGRCFVLAEMEQSVLIDPSDETFKFIQELLGNATSVVWVTKGNLLGGQNPELCLASGLLRTMRAERPSLRSLLIDFEGSVSSAQEMTQLLVSKEKGLWISDVTDMELEYRQKDEAWFIGRVVFNETMISRFRERRNPRDSIHSLRLGDLGPIQLIALQPGLLNSLVFQPDQKFTSTVKYGEVEIKVMATGINMKEVAVIVGAYDSDVLSSDVAGQVVQVGEGVTDIAVGDRVCALAPGRYGNFVRTCSQFCQKMGAKDSFERLATIPVAYCTAIHALKNIANLKQGESVMIQSASGAVGYAAISIAQLVGAEILATAGTPEKRRFLARRFGIAETHIFSSRDISAYREIMTVTAGRGIDVILNTSSGDYLHEVSWRVIAQFGRFVELKRIDILDNGNLQLGQFAKDISFSSFDLHSLALKRPPVVEQLMAEVGELYRAGEITPIDPINVFPLSKIQEGLGFLSRWLHIGKVVLSYEEQDLVPYLPLPDEIMFDPQAAYLLVGGLGGIGRSLAKWMIQRGARNLIFLSRTLMDIRSEDLGIFGEGLNIRLVEGDVANPEDVRRAFQSSAIAIRGVIQLAMVIEDILFAKMTAEQYRRVLRPKVQGAKNLHKISQELAPNLDFFLTFSSLVSLCGPATQSNYAAATMFQNEFAYYRHSQGLPGKSVALGMIGDIGHVQNFPAAYTTLQRNGIYATRERELPELFFPAFFRDQFTQSGSFHEPHEPPLVVCGLDPVRIKRLIENGTCFTDSIAWFSDPLFSHVTGGIDALKHASSHSNVGLDGNTSTLSHTKNSVEWFQQAIIERLAKLLWKEPDRIDAETPLGEYQLDSMVAAELRHWLYKTLHLEVTILDLVSSEMTVGKLAQLAYDVTCERVI